MIILSPGPIGFDGPDAQWQSEGLAGGAPTVGVDDATLYCENRTVSLQFAEYEPPPPPPIVVAGVSPSSFSSAGGDTLVITLGANAVPGDITVLINGQPAYGGQGYGYTPQTDGTTVTVITPPIDTIGTVVLTVQQGTLLSTSFNVQVLERVFPAKAFSLRQSMPPWLAVGPRSLDLEDPL